MGPANQVKNVVVLGASYAGSRAAELLAKELPESHRVVVVDRQSHLNHVYLFPRFGVVPNHAHKAFIPRHNLQYGAPPSPTPSDEREQMAPLRKTSSRGANNRHAVLHASCTAIHEGYIEIDRDLEEGEEFLNGDDGLSTRLANFDLSDLKPSRRRTRTSRRRINYDYLVYATGSNLPPPLLSPARTKHDGVAFLKAQQALIAQSRSILIVGGGALGIQHATDIADLYNNPQNAHHLSSSSSSTRPLSPKKITVVHSRDRFLPLYRSEMHDEVMRRMKELGVEVVLNDRLILPPEEELLKHEKAGGSRKVKTHGGEEREYDLLLRCTGQKPNSSLLGAYLPQALNSYGYVNVLPTTQVALPPDSAPLENVFAIGDVAEAGVIKAGHTGWYQAGVAVENILKVIEGKRMGYEPTLSVYEKSLPQIKVTLGLHHTVSEVLTDDGEGPTTKVVCSDQGSLDEGWEYMWHGQAADPTDPFV